MLKAARQGGSNEYSQSMFWMRNNIIVYPCKSKFKYIKVGYKRLYITRTCFGDHTDVSSLSKIISPNETS